MSYEYVSNRPVPGFLVPPQNEVTPSPGSGPGAL
jgi:hypothetical protein